MPDTVLGLLPDTASGLRPVLNATGVLLHTNLGRAPLSDAARRAVTEAAGPTDVELDLATGARARRGRSALAALRARVPAAGDAHVVNNGAAALVLAATALAAGKEIVVSRGEMVEIGDGFRLPDLLVSTGARLREVGTTNRTTAADYAEVIGPETGFVLKVHPSNFRVTGFTRAAQAGELASLGVPVVVDIGSGLRAPHPGLPAEPDADTQLRAGAALVTASGDKLLGGPQCGLLLGDDQRPVVGQHHPAGTHPDRPGGGGHGGGQHGRRGTGDTGHTVVLGHPEPVVAELLRLPRKRHGVPQRLGGRVPLPDARTVEAGEPGPGDH